MADLIKVIFSIFIAIILFLAGILGLPPSVILEPFAEETEETVIAEPKTIEDFEITQLIIREDPPLVNFVLAPRQWAKWEFRTNKTYAGLIITFNNNFDWDNGSHNGFILIVYGTPTKFVLNEKWEAEAVKYATDWVDTNTYQFVVPVTDWVMIYVMNANIYVLASYIFLIEMN